MKSANFSTRGPHSAAERPLNPPSRAQRRTDIRRNNWLQSSPVILATQRRRAADGSRRPRGARLTIHNDFVAFLEMIADGLSKLADALDLALGDDATKPVEPMFLGTAGKIVEKLKSGLFEYLDKEGANLAGFSIKIGLVAAGYKFLHACGVEGDVAAIVSGILGLKKK